MKLEKCEGVEFMENIRYAVRVFAFRNNKLICIKYKKINKDNNIVSIEIFNGHYSKKIQVF